MKKILTLAVIRLSLTSFEKKQKIEWVSTTDINQWEVKKTDKLLTSSINQPDAVVYLDKEQQIKTVAR